MERTIKLFNSVVITQSTAFSYDDWQLNHMISNGYFVDPRVKPTVQLFSTLDSIVGVSGDKVNSTFRKSWATIRDTEYQELVLGQMRHYMSTYGAERLGVYDEDMVYVPLDDIEDVEIDTLPLVFIRGITVDELKEKVLELTNGVALAEETVGILKSLIVQYYRADPEFIEQINNRELQVSLYDHWGIAPTEPTEWLRYIIYKLTNSTLLIKNRDLITSIKLSNGGQMDKLLWTAPKNLASIFYRYKPLFLAMKDISSNKRFFNQLRRKAPKLHKPMGVDYLNDVTNQIKNGGFNENALSIKLKSASVFRKLRLLDALGYRKNPCDSIVYKVRNGKAWATDFDWGSFSTARHVERAYDIVLKSIADNIKKNVEGKTFYIPEGINYALPATEKQFVGEFPSNTSVEIDTDLVFGIHWYNVNKHRIDLDLSAMLMGGQKVGWDARYRIGDRRDESVLFSGDMTDASDKNGATELLYYPRGVEDNALITVNYYNYMSDVPVPAKIIIAKSRIKDLTCGYMVDPDDIIMSANIIIDKPQTMLGLVMKKDSTSKAVLSNIGVGRYRSIGTSEQAEQTRRYYLHKIENTESLEKVLELAGGIVVREPSEKAVDLSPAALDKTTILSLFK